MSDDDSETGDGDGDAPALTVESLRERLEAIEKRLDEAETEADLDEVEADVEELESDLEAADLPEPDDEDETPPEAEIEGEIEDVRSDLEEQRGPYAEDVAADLESESSTVSGTEWTEDGLASVMDAVGKLAESANVALGESFEVSAGSADSLAETVQTIADAVENSGLDPDEDADQLEALVVATEEFSTALEDAEEWDDLSTREKLRAEGFYDVLDHRKDYPPEWHAIKVHERNGDAEPIVLAYEMLDSDFMEEHCIEAFTRLGAEAALDPMLQLAQRRNKMAVEALGKIASEEPVEDLIDFAGTDGDPQLQKVSLRALGEIGSHEATQAVANQLDSDDDEVRSQAARALGLLGDTRAIDPLSDVLADDEADTVRASAAWALNQIGTERALEAASEYADDRAYLVQVEGETAAELA